MRIIGLALAFVLLSGFSPTMREVLFSKAPVAAGNRISIDQSGNGLCAGNTSTTINLPALTTTSTNELVYVVALHNFDVITSISSATITWEGAVRVNVAGQGLSGWVGLASALTSSEVITVNFGVSGFNEVCVFSIKNANTASRYDANGSIPATSATDPVSGLSISNANDIVIYASRGNSASPAVGAINGVTPTLIANPSFLLIQYILTTSTFSGASANSTNGVVNGAFVDAIKSN